MAAIVHELKFPAKKDIILHGRKVLHPTPGCHTGKMLFANASKIIRNWFLTLQPDNYLQFTKVGTRKGMDVI